jgi:hypothetical protein
MPQSAGRWLGAIHRKEDAMANYRVTSTDKPNTTCPQGNEHVVGAQIENIPNQSLYKTAQELADMRAQGDSFVLVVDNMNMLDWPGVAFDLCPCGSGEYRMVRGQSAIQLTKKAIDDVHKAQGDQQP